METLGGDTGAGVVLFRVPPSRLAPHRLKPTWHCYLRRDDRTEKMTMVEVQDMSVRLARGGEAIKERLEESRRHYLSIPKPWSRGRVFEVGCLVTALPVGGTVYIDRVYRVEELKVLCPNTKALIDGEHQDVWLPGCRTLPRLPFDPILRGGMRTDEDEQSITAETVFSDGLVQFVYKYPDHNVAIFAYVVLGLAANALIVADAARRVAGVPGAELILDVELRGELWEGRHLTGHVGFLLNPTGEQQFPLGPQTLRLPMRPAREWGEFPGVLRGLLDDLRNACGLPHVEQFEIDLSSEE